MALKIRCKDERGEVKNECGVRVILGIREGTKPNGIEGDGRGGAPKE